MMKIVACNHQFDEYTSESIRLEIEQQIISRVRNFIALAGKQPGATIVRRLGDIVYVKVFAQ